LAPNVNVADESLTRLSAVEAQVGRETAAVGGLEKRIGALESAGASQTAKVAAASQAAESLQGEIKSLRADLDAPKGELPGLSARVAKLESQGAQAGAVAPDLAAVNARLDKIESALAAPKAETRVAPEKPSANDNPAAVAIVTGALIDKLSAGTPFPTELAALQSLGVDPAQVEPLKSLADGGSSDGALAAAFEAVEPSALAAVAPKAKGGAIDRFMSNIQGLVQVRALGETTGDDPQALASQVAANLRRGDLAAALAAFDKLPESARKAAQSWASGAKAKQAAESAAQAIREAAVARLVQTAKP
jgi:hypothetical protein